VSLCRYLSFVSPLPRLSASAVTSHVPHAVRVSPCRYLSFASPLPRLIASPSPNTPHRYLAGASELPHSYLTVTSSLPRRYLAVTSPLPHLYLDATSPSPHAKTDSIDNAVSCIASQPLGHAGSPRVCGTPCAVRWRVRHPWPSAPDSVAPRLRGVLACSPPSHLS
jgi:hypothetical protein